MKRLFSIIFFLTISVSFSQTQTIEIDYVIDYLIPSKRTKTTDTISVGFNKDGKYLWTNYPKLAQEFTKKIMKRNNTPIDSGACHIFYDSDNTGLIISLEMNKTVIYANMKISDLVPNVNLNSSKAEKITLVSEKTEDIATIAGTTSNIYEVFPDKEPESKILLFVDENISMNNNQIFSEFLNLVFQAGATDGSTITSNLPVGLITKIEGPGGETLVEAYKITEQKKTIKINHSITISE